MSEEKIIEEQTPPLPPVENFELPQKPRAKNSQPRDYGEELEQKTEPTYSQEKNKYLDEYGDPTYFYQNISQGKIVISDLELTLPMGAPIDLLDMADEERILKSRDFRTATRPHGNISPLLKRLTPEEFEAAYSRYIKRKETIMAEKNKKKEMLDKSEANPKEIKKMSNIGSDEIDVRPQLVSLVEKLRIGNLQVNDKEAEQIVQQKVSGITSDEFLMKVEVMQLSRDEVDYVFQTVGDKRVRSELQKMYTIED